MPSPTPLVLLETTPQRNPCPTFFYDKLGPLIDHEDNVNRYLTTLLAPGYFLCALFFVSAATADEPSALSADHEFVQAAEKGNAAALNKLLEADFTWTDASGRTLSRAEVLSALPKPALGDEASANQVRQIRPQVDAVMASRDKIHVLRMWAKRGSEWRLLIYHEVALGRESAAPADSAVRECENPCKTVPYKPKNDAEQAILSSWQELETAVASRDSFAWAPHIASEFTILGSTNDHPLTKADRVATLNLQKVTGRGSLPPPVVSVQMFDFGDSVVMTAIHQPYVGKAVRVSRLWIKRDGKWLMSLSFQTTIEVSTAKAS